jgi:hypothetical protein
MPGIANRVAVAAVALVAPPSQRPLPGAEDVAASVGERRQRLADGIEIVDELELEFGHPT